MSEVYTFEIRVAQDKDVCIVSMETPGFENIQGSSKRHPTDTFHHTIGECVAFGRLFKTLSEHYEQIVIALQNPPDPETGTSLLETAWLQQFGVPSQEMGIVQDVDMRQEQGEQGNE